MRVMAVNIKLDCSTRLADLQEQLRANGARQNLQRVSIAWKENLNLIRAQTHLKEYSERMKWTNSESEIHGQETDSPFEPQNGFRRMSQYPATVADLDQTQAEWRKRKSAARLNAQGPIRPVRCWCRVMNEQEMKLRETLPCLWEVGGKEFLGDTCARVVSIQRPVKARHTGDRGMLLAALKDKAGAAGSTETGMDARTYIRDLNDLESRRIQVRPVLLGPLKSKCFIRSVNIRGAYTGETRGPTYRT
ncbi:hypothetical protein B0H11DRAFT_1909805 [Mycena galericulata]|nr:hypothetical protein B0H11DRAFT_1909805 [Mycena galericulata]